MSALPAGVRTAIVDWLDRRGYLLFRRARLPERMAELGYVLVSTRELEAKHASIEVAEQVSSTEAMSEELVRQGYLVLERDRIHQEMSGMGYLLFGAETLADELGRLGYEVFPREAIYNQDGLVSHHNRSFMDDAGFRAAYDRGLKAAAGIDPRHHWRVHVAIWSAGVAQAADGDYLECGVNAGFMSSAIMHALDWNAGSRRFFLVDTFAGPPLDQYTDAERAGGSQAKAEDAIQREAYITDVERIRANFAEWDGAVVVQGRVPECLERVDSESVAFLHLDMNAAAPERDALRWAWPRMPAGAVVLLDDYAHVGYEEQKRVIDDLGDELGYTTLSLPTGQGLIIKR